MAPHVQIAADTDAMRRALLASRGHRVTTATVVQQEGNRPARWRSTAGAHGRAGRRGVTDWCVIPISWPRRSVARRLAFPGVGAPGAQRIIAPTAQSEFRAERAVSAQQARFCPETANRQFQRRRRQGLMTVCVPFPVDWNEVG
jgi:hypothetical protein